MKIPYTNEGIYESGNENPLLDRLERAGYLFIFLDNASNLLEKSKILKRFSQKMKLGRLK